MFGLSIQLVLINLVCVLWICFALYHALGPYESLAHLKKDSGTTGGITTVTAIAFGIVFSTIGSLTGYNWAVVGLGVVALTWFFAWALDFDIEERGREYRWRRAVETFPTPPGFSGRLPPPNGYYDVRAGVIRDESGRPHSGLEKSDFL